MPGWFCREAGSFYGINNQRIAKPVNVSCLHYNVMIEAIPVEWLLWEWGVHVILPMFVTVDDTPRGKTDLLST